MLSLGGSRYLTAVPKWPGSGMAKPAKSIGFICLEVVELNRDLCRRCCGSWDWNWRSLRGWHC